MLLDLVGTEENGIEHAEQVEGLTTRRCGGAYAQQRIEIERVGLEAHGERGHIALAQHHLAAPGKAFQFVLSILEGYLRGRPRDVALHLEATPAPLPPAFDAGLAIRQGPTRKGTEVAAFEGKHAGEFRRTIAVRDLAIGEAHGRTSRQASAGILDGDAIRRDACRKLHVVHGLAACGEHIDGEAEAAIQRLRHVGDEGVGERQHAAGAPCRQRFAAQHGVEIDARRLEVDLALEAAGEVQPRCAFNERARILRVIGRDLDLGEVGAVGIGLELGAEGQRAKSAFHAALLPFRRLGCHRHITFEGGILPAAIDREDGQHRIARCHADAEAEGLVVLVDAAREGEGHGRLAPVAGALEPPRPFDGIGGHGGVHGGEIGSEALLAVVDGEAAVRQLDLVEAHVGEQRRAAQVLIGIEQPVHRAIGVADEGDLGFHQFHTVDIEIAVEQSAQLQRERHHIGVEQRRAVDAGGIADGHVLGGELRPGEQRNLHVAADLHLAAGQAIAVGFEALLVAVPVDDIGRGQKRRHDDEQKNAEIEDR